MPTFQLLRCMVALGGDQGNTVYRHRGNPIVFPELPILQFLHGDEAIFDVAVVGTWDTTNDEVLQRINLIYGMDAVKEVFPGARPRLPPGDNSIPICTRPIYKPKPTLPDSPDPKLRPLNQFTTPAGASVVEAPEWRDTEPTADEIAAHAQDDADEDEADEMGLEVPPMPQPVSMAVAAAALPKVEDQPRIVRNTHGRGSIANTRKTGSGTTHLPDVNAGGSRSPHYHRSS